MNTDKQSMRLDALDGLRGLCACLVYFYHRNIWQDNLASGFNQADWISGLLTVGSKLGVCIFFVLSAFLFTRKILNNELGDPIAFVIGRFCRIAPLCWLIILLTLGYSCITTGSIGLPFNVFIKRLIIWMSGGLRDGPTPLVDPMEWWHYVAANWWTLRHEWLLYIFMPLATTLVNKSSWRPISILTTAVMLVVFKGHFDILMHSANVSFIAGCFLALLSRREQQRYVIWILVLCSVLSLSIQQYLPEYLPYAFPALTVTYLSLYNKYTQRVLSFLPVRKLGESSYSIYMLHGFVILISKNLIIKSNQENYILLCILQFITIALISRFSYITIEAYGIKLSRKISTIISDRNQSTWNRF